MNYFGKRKLITIDLFMMKQAELFEELKKIPIDEFASTINTYRAYDLPPISQVDPDQRVRIKRFHDSFSRLELELKTKLNLLEFVKVVGSLTYADFFMADVNSFWSTMAKDFAADVYYEPMKRLHVTLYN